MKGGVNYKGPEKGAIYSITVSPFVFVGSIVEASPHRWIMDVQNIDKQGGKTPVNVYVGAHPSRYKRKRGAQNERDGIGFGRTCTE